MKEKELLNLINDDDFDGDIREGLNDIDSISIEMKKNKLKENTVKMEIVANEDNRDDIVDNSFISNFPYGSLDTLFGFLTENWSYIIGQGDVVPTSFETIHDAPSGEKDAKWVGSPYPIDSEKVFYEGVSIDGVEYRVFDSVILKSARTRQQLPIMIRIIALFEEASRKRAVIECYYRPADFLSIMNILRISGENPLIFLHESQDEENVKPQKRKRGRPPKKRMLNIEDSINVLKSCSEHEIFTSLRPYVDCVSISSFDLKCTVDHVLPTWTPNQSSKLLTNWFFYKKALELKTCSLVICKPRPTKPRSWIDLLEKRNKDKRYSLPSRERTDSRFDHLLSQPKIQSSKKKKRKSFSDDEELDEVFEEDSSFVSENSIEDIHSRSHSSLLPTQHDIQPLKRSEVLFPHIMEKMEAMSELITQSLSTMQEAIESMQGDVLVNLDEIKRSLQDIKDHNTEDIPIPSTENLVDGFGELNNSNSFSSEIFNPFNM